MPQLDVQQTAGAAGLFHGTIVIAQLAPRQGVSRIRHAPLWEDWGGLGRTENWGWWKWGARNEKYGGGGGTRCAVVAVAIIHDIGCDEVSLMSK